MEEEQQAAKGGEEIVRAIVKPLKVLIMFVGKMFKWLFGFIAAHLPYFLIFIVIIAFVAIIVSALTAIFNGGYDPDSGTMSPIAGITGTEFYGQRYMYYDEQYTANDLADTYLEFTYNILKDVNNDTTINIDFTSPYNANTQTNVITTSFASALSGESGKTLIEYTAVIDHYGFTEAEHEIVLNTLTNYVVGNSLVSVESSTFMNYLKASYDENFAYMKNVCKKILIKDYILEQDKTVENITKENYFGLIYMPRQIVTLDYTSYVFVVDSEKTVDIKIVYTDGTTETTLGEATADSTWYVDGKTEKMLETDSTKDYMLNPFTAIDENEINYFSEEKTLFKVLRDGKYLTYFKDTNGDYSEETLLKNVNTGNYLYMQLSSDSSYNLGEAFVDVKTY